MIAAAVYESSPPLRRTTASPPGPPRDDPMATEGSDTARRRIPDEFVELKLDAGGNAIGEHPFRQRPRVHHAVDRRQVDGRRARSEIVPGDDVARVVVVRAVLDHELDLVV